MAEQWMSIVDYARALSISDMTVRRRIKNGKLHAVLRDGKYFIPVSAGAPKQIMDLDDVSIASPVGVRSIPSSSQQRPEPTIIDHSYVRDSGESYTANGERDRDQDSRENYGRKVIPESIRASIASHGQTLVDSQSLLQFCEKSLVRLGSIEKHISDSYRSKIQALEERLRAKDLEIARLHQQLEDLQTLINMMDYSPSKPK